MTEGQCKLRDKRMGMLRGIRKSTLRDSMAWMLCDRGKLTLRCRKIRMLREGGVTLYTRKVLIIRDRGEGVCVTGQGLTLESVH